MSLGQCPAQSRSNYEVMPGYSRFYAVRSWNPPKMLVLQNLTVQTEPFLFLSVVFPPATAMNPQLHPRNFLLNRHQGAAAILPKIFCRLNKPSSLNFSSLVSVPAPWPATLWWLLYKSRPNQFRALIFPN